MAEHMTLLKTRWCGEAGGTGMGSVDGAWGGVGSTQAEASVLELCLISLSCHKLWGTQLLEACFPTQNGSALGRA